MAEEKKWLKERLEGIRKGSEIKLCAFDAKRLAGSCDAKRGSGREIGNVVLGLAVSRDYRGMGLGELLLRRTAALAKKKFKPRNIYLTCTEGNRPALSLYKKVGFRKIARMPKWVRYKGEYLDSVLMLLKK